MIKINKKRKGFTIVELVIVIAVIAILAGVLIPTFASIVEKANQSSDIQAVRQMNVILMAESVEEKPTGVDRVIEIISEGGYDTVEKRTPKTTNHGFYWCNRDGENIIILVKGTSELIYPEDNAKLNAFFAETDFNVTTAAYFHSIGTNAGTNGEFEEINWEEVLEAGFIKLTKNAKIDETIVIPLGTELSIDLNDCTLIINEQAQLLVKGCLSVKNGDIISKSAVDDGGIYNNGTLILSGVNLTITEDGNYGIYNGSECMVSIDNKSKFIIINSTNPSGVRILYNFGTVIIKNSSFDAKFISESVNEAPIYEAPIENCGTLDMTNINITSDCFCTINTGSGTILIDNSIGGKLECGDGYARNCYYDWSSYTPGDERNYKYISNGVVDEDVMHQALLNEQIKTLNNGGSITLESDGYLTTAVTISSDATLNLNGHTLTMIVSGSLNINNKLTIENGEIVVGTMYSDTAINVNSGATASINGCTIKYYEDDYYFTPRLLDNQGELTISDSTIDTLNVYDNAYKTYKGRIEDVLNFNFNSNNFEPFISTGTIKDLTNVQIKAFNCTIDFISSNEIKITHKQKLNYAPINIVENPLEIAAGKTVTIVFDDKTGNKDFTIKNTITVYGILNIEGISGNPAYINATYDVISFNVKEKGKINFTNCTMKVQQEPTIYPIVVETEDVGAELKNFSMITIDHNIISNYDKHIGGTLTGTDGVVSVTKKTGA